MIYEFTDIRGMKELAQADNLTDALDMVGIPDNELKSIIRLSERPLVKFKLMHKDARLPVQVRRGDAGYDLYTPENVLIYPGQQSIIPTGVMCELPEGYAGFIWPRSGMATKHMMDVHAGLIDQNYRGEINVCLINHGDRPIEVKKGDRIAQMVIQPYQSGSIVVDNLTSTDRGELGFGSSGV